MLSLTAGMRYKYCEGNLSFRYKWDAMINYIRYVLHEDPWSGTVFIFMNRRHNQLRVWSDLIDFIGCEGIDLNSFVHSQWHKHAKTA